MARRHGSKGQVLMDPAGGTTTVAVGDLNAWTLDSSRDRVETSAFGDVNKTYVQGLPDMKGTFGGFWNSASSPALFDAAEGDTAVTLELVPSTLDPTYLFTGPAYLDASINVAANGAITVGGSWVAAGAWAREP